MSTYSRLIELAESMEGLAEMTSHDADKAFRAAAQMVRTFAQELPGSPMIRIEGKQLENLIDRLKHGTSVPTYLLRADYRGDRIAFKVNESTWDGGLGSIQEPY